jgi:CheY-like chemotaxis protein
MDEPITGIRVVVVEDHPDTRDLLEQSLRYAGAVVTALSVAREAVNLVSQADVIITDFLLSNAEEDGAWLLEQVNRQSRPVPVIALSGVSETQNQRLAQAPFARKLLKPVDPSDLCREILDVVRG